MRVFGNRVLIKINKVDREKETIKEIIRDDGTKGHIYIGNDYRMETVKGGSARLIQVQKEDDISSQNFARFGEVVGVGDGVTEIQVGDTAILDYKVYNDEGIVVEDCPEYKLVCPIAVTDYVKEDKIAYADRKFPKDRILAKKGEIEAITDIHGVIRNGELIAISPYVILNYTPTKTKVTTQSGIFYDEPIRILQTKVISAAKDSTLNFGVAEGASVKVKEGDVFKIDINNEPYYFCNDSDVMGIVYEKAETLNGVI